MVDAEKTALHEEMPRREFIRKSLIASGGIFMSMETLGKLSLPELDSNNKPAKPSSGKKDRRDDDDDGDKGDNDFGSTGGRYGGNRLSVITDEDD